MASGFRAHRARYAVLACLVIVLAATLGSFVARWRARRPEPPRPAPIAQDVSQRTQAFSLSKTLGEHTLYTIDAEQVTNYEANGKADLRNVSVLIFGKDGSRHDRITAPECLYDSTAASIWVPGDVEMQFDVPLEPSASSAPQHAPSSTPVSIRTSQLSFDQNTGIASTDAPVHFQFAQGEGSSEGARYDPQKQELTLPKNVEFHLTAARPGTAAAEPTEIRAAALRFDRERGQVALENSVEITKGTRHIRATQGELLLNSSYAVDKAALQGEIVATENSEDFSAELRAQRADVEFGSEGKVSALDASGDASGDANDVVRWTASSMASGQSREGQAQHVEMFFHEGTGALERAVAQGHVRMVFRRSGGRPLSGRPASQVVSGEQVEAKMLPDGKTIASATVSSSASLILEPPNASADRRTVTADHFDLGFYPAGGFSDFRAEKNVRVISDATAGPIRHREATSDSLEASFDPATGEVSRIRQWGNFNYRDPERQARAQTADYLAAKNSIALSGDPVVWDSDGKLTAKRIEIQSGSGGLTAEEQVASTFIQKPSPSGDPAQPLHAVADRLEYDGAKKTSRFQGHSRLWQGDSFLVEAESIQWSPQSGELLAQKQVYSIFREEPDSSDSQKPARPRTTGSRSPGRKAPNSNAGDAKESNASGRDDTVTIRADSFLYNHAQRLAHYEGTVRMQSASGAVSAASLDVFLKQPASQTAADLSLSSGQIERAVANDHVRIVEEAPEKGRVATGDVAEYLPSQSEVHLSGKLAKVTDPRRGTLEAPELTYFLGDDRIQVQGSPGSPTETRWQVRP
jgi:lipopolysaccharide export system protein LptA